jgi:hypothetical protein
LLIDVDSIQQLSEIFQTAVNISYGINFLHKTYDNSTI